MQASVSSIVPRGNIDSCNIDTVVASTCSQFIFPLQSLLRALQLLIHYWVILVATYSMYPGLYTISENQFFWADNQQIVVWVSASVVVVLVEVNVNPNSSPDFQMHGNIWL